MHFEWDEDKRRANILKHGIDFADAKDIFDGRPGYDSASAYTAEMRRVTVAELLGRLIAVVWTPRDGGNAIRIISARSARRDEKGKYRTLHG
jgi:uncharacterized protein